MEDCQSSGLVCTRCFCAWSYRGFDWEFEDGDPCPDMRNLSPGAPACMGMLLPLRLWPKRARKRYEEWLAMPMHKRREYGDALAGLKARP